MHKNKFSSPALRSLLLNMPSLNQVKL